MEKLTVLLLIKCGLLQRLKIKVTKSFCFRGKVDFNAIICSIDWYPLHRNGQLKDINYLFFSFNRFPHNLTPLQQKILKTLCIKEKLLIMTVNSKILITFFSVNRIPHTYAFWRLCSRRLLKTLCKMEKLLIMSNISFGHNNFNCIQPLYSIVIHILRDFPYFCLDVFKVFCFGIVMDMG